MITLQTANHTQISSYLFATGYYEGEDDTVDMDLLQLRAVIISIKEEDKFKEWVNQLRASK